jgi:hypothetical protein
MDNINNKISKKISIIDGGGYRAPTATTGLNINHPIFYGITDIIPYWHYGGSFTPTNGGVSLGIINKSTSNSQYDAEIVNYLDNDEKGRRVDINIYFMENYLNNYKLLVQALIWAAKKLPKTSKILQFNPNSIKLNNNLDANNYAINNLKTGSIDPLALSNPGIM